MIEKSLPPLSIHGDGDVLKVQWWANKWHFAWFSYQTDDQLVFERLDLLDTGEQSFEEPNDFDTVLEKAESVSSRVYPSLSDLPDSIHDQLRLNGFEIADPGGA